MHAGNGQRCRLVDRDDPRMRMRRAQQLDVQQALDRGIEGVARRAAHHAAGRRARAGCGRRRRRPRRPRYWSCRRARPRSRDSRCSGRDCLSARRRDPAAAPGSATRRSGSCRRCRSRTETPGRRGTPAASDAGRPSLASPSMVVTAWPSARNAGIRQLCTGSPSSSTVQAPQSPASQPFLTPKWPSSRRKVRRHCPARGLSRNVLPLISKVMVAPCREFAANLLGEPQRHVLAPDRLAVDVVVVEVVGNLVQRSPRAARPRLAASANDIRTGRTVDAVTVSTQGRRRGRRCRSAAPRSGRPASARSAERPSAASARRAAMSICRSRSPGVEHVLLVAGDEVDDRDSSARRRRPSRSCRRRRAPRSARSSDPPAATCRDCRRRSRSSRS